MKAKRSKIAESKKQIEGDYIFSYLSIYHGSTFMDSRFKKHH